MADWNGAVRAHAPDRVVARAQASARGRTLTDMDAWRSAGSPRPQLPVEVPEPAGKRTAAHAYALLHQVMLAALDEDLIARDPCRVKGADAAKAPERKPATRAEVAAAAAAMPARRSAMIPVTAWGYLRKGEVLGLQRQDVTFGRDADGTITGAQLPGAGREVLARPRDGHGPTEERPFSAHVAPARILAEHMEKYTGRAATAHTCSLARADRWSTPDASAAPGGARKAAGRPRLRFHDLRHTGATEARRAGGSLPQLKRLLGHSTLAAVAICQHGNVDDLDLVAARLDERLTATA